MLGKIEAMKEAAGLDNPINASIVSLLTISLQKLTKQLDDDEEFAGDDGERLLYDLLMGSREVVDALHNYIDRMEDN